MAHPVTHENALSYYFRVSGSASESASWFCRIDPDCDTEIFWYQLLFSEQGKIGAAGCLAAADVVLIRLGAVCAWAKH
jgi:hypothetical protein